MRHPLLKILLAVLFVLTLAPVVKAEKRIGVIMTGDIPYYREIHEALVGEITRLSEGKEKVEIILQRPFPNTLSWTNAARKLIAFDVDLIITYGSPATQAVIDEKSRIPLLYVGLYEPDNTAINLKNVTGCGFKVPLSSILRYMKRLKDINSLGIIFSSIEEDSVRQYETMKTLAERQNIQILKIDIRSQADLGKLKTVKMDGAFITGSSLAHLWLDDIIDILDDEQIPTADIFPDDKESGVLMTLHQPPHSQGEMAAEMAWQVLRGENPADISQHIFRETELVINNAEAKHIGISLPIQLLIEATRVIE